MKGGAPRAERPSLRERARAWWRARPLGVTFAACVAVYLLVATAACLALIGATETVEDVYRRSVTGIDEDSWLFSDPYIYDSAAHELRPATEISVPGAEGLAVFWPRARTRGRSAPRPVRPRRSVRTLNSPRAMPPWPASSGARSA